MRASTVGRRSLDRSGALYRFISTHDLYQRFYMVAVLYVYIYIIRASGGNSSRGDRTLVFIGCNDRAALLATLRRLPWLPSTRARGQLSELSASQVPPANNEDAGAWPASKGPATEQRPGQRESETSESAVTSAASTTAGGIVHRDRPRPFGRRCLVWNDGVVRR